MRFFADGPNIPERLLEDRDNGNVVFFCGAGISQPAGLPGFARLAEQVVEELGAPPDAKVRAMLARAKQELGGTVPLDQIFSILQHEYRSANIGDIVSRLLRTRTSANVDQHQIVLRLSRNAAHQVQIVTTNFDLLFERAQKGIPKHVAPALPDLSSGQPLVGLVYLHGRVNASTKPRTERHQLILSSADFGRAYLADAWATRFVRELLKNYVIVLLGYSANDPPVRYLLEGLHARAALDSSRIYAFDQGSEADVLDRWRDRGVIPLAYPKSPAHSTLWRSLQAWADRAENPEHWRRSTLALASSNPKGLAPYERGQVVSLVRTTEGAKLFGTASDVPPAEWICVFDKFVRYGEPQDLGTETEIDPLAIYGLDDDPPRSKENGVNTPLAIDVLSSSPFDERKKEYNRLAGINSAAADPLSPRLFYISRWFGKVLNQSAAIWWAGGYFSLHLGLREQIEWYIDHSNLEFDPRSRRLWELLLEKFERSSDPQNLVYNVAAKIKRSGWSALRHYEFEDAIQPFLKSRRPLQSGPIPPEGRCDESNDSLIINLEVEFPARGGTELKPPPEEVYRLFRSVRRGLERGGTLLKALDTRFWHTASFQNDQRPGERYLSASDSYVFWARDLFDQVCAQNQSLARSEVLRWPRDDEYFFDKLRLHAWTIPSLFAGEEVGQGLIQIHDHGFWDSYLRRELLHLLRDRWNDIPLEIRKQIEDRIIAGYPIKEERNTDEARNHRDRITASMLGWLRQNGSALSDHALRHLSAIQAASPDWNMGWESSADQSLDGRTGFVVVKADPTKIVDLPVPQIIDAADEHSTRPFMEFTENRPFSGLVKQRPRLALAALAYQARRGNFALTFWETALADWPNNLNQRLQCLFGARLARLPPHIISQLPHYAPRWISNHLPNLAKNDLKNALIVWDAVFGGLISGGATALQSGVGDSSIGGKKLDRSRRTYDHAINGPVGILTETLFQILNDLKLGAQSGIPDEIRQRLERALIAPGDGADHSICVVTFYLTWLFYLDPSWVTQRIIPIFSVERSQAEPAWNGFLHNRNLGTPELFALLKVNFLKVFEIAITWRWDDQPIDRLHEFLVIACYWHKKSGLYVDFSETRLALQRTTDGGRSHAIWQLDAIVSEQKAWRSFGKFFILKAWPMEAHFQTASSSRQFAAMADSSGDNFPDVVRTLSPLLIPSNQLDLFVYQTKEHGGDGEEPAAKLPRKFPSAMLTLLDRLVDDDPNLAPYDLGSLVDIIADADAGLRQDPRWRRLSRIAHAR